MFHVLISACLLILYDKALGYAKVIQDDRCSSYYVCLFVFSLGFFDLLLPHAVLTVFHKSVLQKIITVPMSMASLF